MIAELLKQNLIRIRRSPEFQKRVATNIILGFLILISMLNFLYISFNISRLLRATPGIDPVKVMNEVAFFFIPADYILRLIFQKYRSSAVKPYLILNIPRKKIVELMLIKTSQSLLNLIPFFLFMPFAFMELAERFSFISVAGWFTAILYVCGANAYLANYTKIKFRVIPVKTVIVTGLALGAVAATFFFHPAYPQIWSEAFTIILENPVFSFVPLVAAILMFRLNYRFLFNNLFTEESAGTNKNAKSRERELKESFSFLSMLGRTGTFILLELKMVFRNKRPKPLFFMSFIMVFYGLLFLSQPVHSEFLLIFMSSFMTGVFTLSYGIIIFGWESSYFSIIMTGNIDFKLYIKAKYYFMAAVTTVLFLLMSFYIIFGIWLYVIIAEVFLFNIGITPFIILSMATFNRMRYNLQDGMFSQQGRGTQQYLGALVVLGLQLGIIYLLRFIMSFEGALLVIAAIGLAGLIMHNYFIELIEKLFYKRKYIMIDGFKKT